MDGWLWNFACMSGTMMPTMCHILVVTQWPNYIFFKCIVLFCLSEDMSPYCSAHDEWLIMKLCMYVGYHDANNVSNFGSDQVKLKKPFFSIIYAVLRTWRSIAAAVATRPCADCSSMEGHTSLSTALVIYLFNFLICLMYFVIIIIYS